MASLRNRFVFPLDYWTGAAFRQKRLNPGDIQVIFKRLRSSGYKFVQNVEVKPYSERASATTDQSAVRELFIQAQVATDVIMRDSEQRAAAELGFKKQYTYSTLRGYVFAREFKRLQSNEP